MLNASADEEHTFDRRMGHALKKLGSVRIRIDDPEHCHEPTSVTPFELGKKAFELLARSMPRPSARWSGQHADNDRWFSSFEDAMRWFGG